VETSSAWEAVSVPSAPDSWFRLVGLVCGEQAESDTKRKTKKQR